MHRTRVLLVALLVGLVWAAPAMAQGTLSLNVGWFTVRGVEDRVPGDTLNANLFAESPYALSFRMSDFDNVTYGADWLIPISPLFEVGVGANYYARTVPSYYQDLTDTNGGDIRQNLRLRTVPITASIRWLLVGRHHPVEPYVGFGLSVVPWDYSEVGDFVDTSMNIYSANYHDSGVVFGSTLMAGIRVKPAPKVSFGGEIRYLTADASLDPSVGFLGSHIDLGGVSYLATFNIKF